MRLLIAAELVFLLMAASAIAQQESTKTLRIYLVDVEGGNATLFVSPSGEARLRFADRPYSAFVVSSSSRTEARASSSRRR